MQVRILETTSELAAYQFTSYALQALLQHYSGDGPGGPGGAGSAAGSGAGACLACRTDSDTDEPGGLYMELRPDVRPLVRPYLHTR